MLMSVGVCMCVVYVCGVRCGGGKGFWEEGGKQRIIKDLRIGANFDSSPPPSSSPSILSMLGVVAATWMAASMSPSRPVTLPTSLWPREERLLAAISCSCLRNTAYVSLHIRTNILCAPPSHLHTQLSHFTQPNTNHALPPSHLANTFTDTYVHSITPSPSQTHALHHLQGHMHSITFTDTYTPSPLRMYALHHLQGHTP